MKFGTALRVGTAALALAMAAFSLGQKIKVNVDGTPVDFTNGQPVMIGGRVLVPLRGVLEQMGANVDYDSATHTVNASKNGLSLQLQLGSRTAIVNNQSVSLDQPARTIDGSTMVPLRFVSEALGAAVNWDSYAETVDINTGSANNVGQQTTTTTATQPVVPPEAAPVAISSFSFDGSGWVHMGQPITFTLVGSPGAKAMLFIPGVTKSMQMTESTPGTYTAVWTPDQSSLNTNLVTDAAVIATLARGEHQQMLEANKNISVDMTSPTLSVITPLDQSTFSRTRPTIVAMLDDANGSGIDRNSVHVTLNGNDVTRDATITDTSVTYHPGADLAPGMYTVQVTAADLAGNTATKSWSFNVNPSTTVATLDYDAQGPVAVGQMVTFTLHAQPGAHVTLSIGDRVMNLPMAEASPGVYTAAYTIRDKDVFVEEPVKATVNVNGETYAINADTPMSMAFSELQRPVITTPILGAPFSQPMVIEGTAAPGSSVDVRVWFDTNSPGYKASGTLSETIVTADANGHWATEPVNFDSVVRGTNTTYTITAYAYLPGGRRSTKTEIKIKG